MLNKLQAPRLEEPFVQILRRKQHFVDNALQKALQYSTDLRLARIVEVWSRLDESIRRAIIALIDSTD